MYQELFLIISRNLTDVYVKPAVVNRNWAVVVTQWVARSLPIPEDLGPYLVTGNFYWTIIHC